MFGLLQTRFLETSIIIMAIEIKENIVLAPYTIYKIGGPTRFFVRIKNTLELQEALVFCAQKKIPFFVFGAGSNVLVADNGFDGLLIHAAGGDTRVARDRIFADAGVMVARVVLESAKAGLSGLEWGIGIPGSVGGSIRGNAGCFGGEMRDIVESVEYFDTREATCRKLPAARCEFAYRDSVFKAHPEWVILSAVFKLAHGDEKSIREKIARITGERTAHQDIGTKSCGCIFKNVSWRRHDIKKDELLRRFPELQQFSEKKHIPASFLIDRSSLKDRRVGHVVISSRHANYFINEGGAKAEEVVILIGIAKDTVRRTFGILLEEEIQYVGF